MVDPLSGGPAESPELLARQAAQHWAELPAAPTDDPGWILVEEGFTLAREHEVESLSRSETAMRDRVGHLRSAARSPHLRLSWREYSIRRQALCQGLAPTADWTRLSGTIDGQPLRLDRGHNLEHRRIFDMRKAFSGGSGDIKMNPVGSRGYERCASPQWPTVTSWFNA